MFVVVVRTIDAVAALPYTSESSPAVARGIPLSCSGIHTRSEVGVPVVRAGECGVIDLL